MTHPKIKRKFFFLFWSCNRKRNEHGSKIYYILSEHTEQHEENKIYSYRLLQKEFKDG